MLDAEGVIPLDRKDPETNEELGTDTGIDAVLTRLSVELSLTAVVSV